MKDKFGLEHSHASEEAINAFNHYAQQIIAFGKDFDPLLEAVQNHPGSIMLQLAAAHYWIYSQEKRSICNCQVFLDAAQKLLNQANERERWYFEITQLWLNNNYPEAIIQAEKFLVKMPEDLLMAAIIQFFYFCGGQYFYGKRFKKTMDAIESHHQNNADYYAMQSFSHELSEDYDEAIMLAEKSLSIDENTPWAHHSLAHAYIMQGETEKGISAIAPYANTWQNFCRPVHLHNAWHLALFRLDNNETESALALYDNQIWGVNPESVQEQIDAIALLWRMHIVGENVGQRWEDLKPYIKGRTEDLINPFLSAHFVYALARVGEEDEARELLANAAKFADQQEGELKRVWFEVGLRVLEFVLSYATKNYSNSIYQSRALIESEFYCIGGSDAQDDLFCQTYMSSLVKTNELRDARLFLKHLTRNRKQTSLTDQYWHSQLG